ncbi:EAL domain-containing protein [Izhakiella australiensis]|uniref:EAL domain-containing protein n=1 Tax=Izhakiella australiensis TaxID=1926881 RepID=UPI001F523F4A|nr:EAL domain-containing protein [Izhakiella australiensis]
MKKLGSKPIVRHWTLLAAAALLPLLLSLIFSYFAARSQLGRHMNSIGESLMNQSEQISDRAQDMLNTLQRFAGQPCESSLIDIQRISNLNAYFRSIGLLQGNQIVCSSAYGSFTGPLNALISPPLFNTQHLTSSISVAGTYGVPHRSAVLYLRRPHGDRGSYAIVEGQYLLDFMQAVGRPRGDVLSLRVGDGYAIRSGWLPPNNNPLWGNSQLTLHSTRYPIALSVESPASEFLRIWQQLLLTFLPLGIILALVFSLMANNWLKRRLSFHDEMRRAIARDEFFVVYQPVYSNKTGEASGAEALMRWQRSNGEWVSPDIFIAAAEAEAMIIPLTRHLLSLIVRDSADWQVPAGFHLGVNVAAEHLQDASFLDDIRQFARHMALHTQQLNITLELTERSLIGDPQTVISKLEELRSEGFRVAIDDFGTGHCTLSYLQTFPLDYLKIDKGFVAAIEQVNGETPVLDTIIQLSHKLALQTVAEGVETPLQFHYLKQRGVTFIQGYLYARPMRSEEMINWLKNPPPFPPEI